MSAGRIALEGEFTIQNAVQMRERLLAALAASETVELDLAGVTEFDSAGLQLLLAAGKSAKAAGRLLRIVATSPSVAEVLEFLALGDLVDASGAAS